MSTGDDKPTAKGGGEAAPAKAERASADLGDFPQPEEHHRAGDEQPRAKEIAAQLASISPYRDSYKPECAGTPIVQFSDVTKTFGDGPTAFTAIKDVNFHVDDKPGKGEFISVLGPSGCGKSTVLRLIAGLSPQHPATSGQVLVDGKPILGPGADRGMVFQDYTSFDHRTVEGNVGFGLECRGDDRDKRRELAREWIAKVGLSVENDADKYPHQLSGGMRQRVAIARTLVLRPRIILMDEPFGALDPATRLHMQDLLVSLWRELEATVFFVTHSIEEAVFLGDRIYVLSSSPGTILEEIAVPPPDWPAKDMQRHPEFLEYVFHIRDMIEQLESSQRAGDD
jgi:NitT/TauT family transport system ATP-binding protein